ncbi:MAG: CHASE2 domain-containing protein, partial [Cyanobacteria bacterium J06641_5]
IRYEDVQSALFETCRKLKTDYKQTYPSAYLVPSLYRHPDAKLFVVRRFGWRQQLRRLRPSRWEAIASAALLSAGMSFPLLGWNSPVQAWLLEHRMLVQGLYRQLTRQMPPADPPILLVQIDDSSLATANVSQRYPMDRGYLAKLARKAVALKFPVIGLDYSLAGARPEDAALAQAIRAGADSASLFVFAADKQCPDCEWLLARPEIAAPDRSWHGDARLWTVGRADYPIYPSLLPPAAKQTTEEGAAELPFAYLLALGDALYEESPDAWQTQYQQPPGQLIERLFDPRMAVQKSTLFFYRFGQIWLRPEFDFSLAPNRIFVSISAADFLATEAGERQYPQSTVAIIPGDYQEATDRFYAPRPIEYWNRSLQDIKGGELHAYAFHHFRNKHLVARVPDLWLLLPAFLVGKVVARALRYHPQHRRWGFGLVGLTIVYGLVSLQVYISGQIIFGWVLPSAAFWVYNAMLFRRKSDAV